MMDDILLTFRKGECHSSGIDLAGLVVVSEDPALCLYDYADILLEEDQTDGNTT